MARTGYNNPNLHTDLFPFTEGATALVEEAPASLQTAASEPLFPRKGLSSCQVRQTKRVQRMSRVSMFAALFVLILAIFRTQSLIGVAAFASIAGIVGIAVLTLYGVFVCGLNLKFSEKSLTAPIAALSVAILLATFYLAPQSESVFVPFVFVVLAYGTYRLPMWTMFLLSTGVLVGHAAVICLHHWQHANYLELRVAILHWTVLALTLPGFIVLTGRVRRLHSALHKAGVRIKNIEENARRDSLLGCFNRRYMIAALEEQKRHADESGLPLCLAVIDLDHFKRINDEVGHLAGDDVLRIFSRVAQANVRQTDVFGRYGGEEFVLVLPETPLLAALNTAERIREQVESHPWQGRPQRPVTVSIGLTQYIPGESVLDLFSRTDMAMYLAKRGGRNQVVVEEPKVEMWQSTE